ncbi:MAG: sugar phosphate isomerase/epimerase [Oscillospiraceae bacterium]|jgi:sugar phosphate isomerase/epimerase|nr:sugar phosphate isomerase/epimerase [Oscillospiraceae bacterium]
MAIGVQGYTIRYRVYDNDQVESAYKRLAAMGYDGMEGGLGNRRLSPEEDMALLEKYGLKVAGAYGDISKPDEAMALAEKYNVKLLYLPAIPGDLLNSVEGFQIHAARMNEMVKPFEGTGFRLMYHHHAQEFRNFPQLDGKSGMQIFLDELNPDLTCFLLDTHWMAASGCDPTQWIGKVKGRIPVIHFKDYAIDWKAQDNGLEQVCKRYAEIGQGNINWPAVLDACIDAGVEWYVVEQDRTVADEFDSLKISIDYMRKIGVK